MKLYILYHNEKPIKCMDNVIATFDTIDLAIYHIKECLYLEDFLPDDGGGYLKLTTITIKEINTGKSKDVKIYKLKENLELVEENNSIRFVKYD